MLKTTGFTIVELLVVVAVFALLTSLAIVSLLGVQRHASLNSAVDSLITDLKQQQTLAMVGEASSPTTLAGIYFQTNSYVLFRGASYVATASSHTVTLPGSIQLGTITFPNSTVVFASGSGEITGFTSGKNTLVLKDSNSNEQKTVTINKYGVVTTVN